MQNGASGREKKLKVQITTPSRGEMQKIKLLSRGSSIFILVLYFIFVAKVCRAFKTIDFLRAFKVLLFFTKIINFVRLVNLR